MKLHVADAWKDNIWQNFLEKNVCSIGPRNQKKSNFPNFPYFSRNSSISQHLEQLGQNRKKYLKAHSTSYQRFLTGFELKSVFMTLEAIKGQNSVFWKNSFSWINVQAINTEQLFWHQCDSLVEPGRNICLITSIGQFWSLTWGHLGSRSCGGSGRSCCISVNAHWRDRLIGTIPMSVSLFNQKLLTNKNGNTALCAPVKGHQRSPALFLWITFDWKEIQTWDLYQCVCLVKAHLLICNMTYMNQHVTLTWDDLRPNFKIDLSRSSSIWFEPTRCETHINVKIIALCWLLQPQTSL